MKRTLYIIYNIIVVACMMVLSSCNDFLDREPISFKSEEAYFHTAEHFKLAVNDFYKYLPQNNAIWGGTYTADCQSDNQCSASYYALFLDNGDYKTQAQSNYNLIWNFDRLRAINFALGKMSAAINEATPADLAR